MTSEIPLEKTRMSGYLQEPLPEHLTWKPAAADRSGEAALKNRFLRNTGTNPMTSEIGPGTRRIGIVDQEASWPPPGYNSPVLSQLEWDYDENGRQVYNLVNPKGTWDKGRLNKGKDFTAGTLIVKDLNEGPAFQAYSRSIGRPYVQSWLEDWERKLS